MIKLAKYSNIFYKLAATFQTCDKCGKVTVTPVSMGDKTLCENCYMEEALKPIDDTGADEVNSAQDFPTCDKCGKTTATPLKAGNQTLCENCYMEEAMKTDTGEL